MIPTKWRDIQVMLSKASPEDLEKTVQVYNSVFGRLFDVVAVDHLDTFKKGIPSDGTAPLVLVIDNAA